MRVAHEALRDAGHEITLDWTTHGKQSFAGKSAPRNREYAIADVEGVKAAESYVLLLGERASTGAHIELGVALGNDTTNYVLLVGEIQHSTLFYDHPKALNVATINSVVEHLDGR